MQVHGRADVTQAVNSLSGATKKAASEALQKVSNSKEGMAVPEVSAVNSYAIAVSCESSPTEHGSRPPSRSGPSSTSVSSAAQNPVLNLGALCLAHGPLRSVEVLTRPINPQVASSRTHKAALPSGPEKPRATKRGCLAVSSKKEERARK